MIKYGLKLWSNNTNLFESAIELYIEKKIDFIELYNNSKQEHDYKKLALLKKAPIVIHNANYQGFHELIIEEFQLKIWKKTIALANFFNSKFIIIHPGKNHTIKSFKENLAKIDDSRIILENMAGIDIFDETIIFANTLPILKEIKKIKPICFDFEKAVKASKQRNLDYKEYIKECITELKPVYFQISGGDENSPNDEHENLWDSNIDFKWIKEQLTELTKNQDVYLLFETPKTQDNKDLENDVKNMDFFRNY